MTKIYTIYEVKEIQTKEGQTKYKLSNLWDTTNRNELADILGVRVDNLARYKSYYNNDNIDIETDYTIKATNKGFTYMIDYE